jgi:hypothetical protein
MNRSSHSLAYICGWLFALVLSFGLFGGFIYRDSLQPKTSKAEKLRMMEKVLDDMAAEAKFRAERMAKEARQ